MGDFELRATFVCKGNVVRSAKPQAAARAFADQVAPLAKGQSFAFEITLTQPLPEYRERGRIGLVLRNKQRLGHERKPPITYHNQLNSPLRFATDFPPRLSAFPPPRLYVKPNFHSVKKVHEPENNKALA